MLDADFVIAIHDEIVAELGGLPGLGAGGRGAIESALQRVQNHAHYAELDDVLGIAALYAEAIARGHTFADAHKPSQVDPPTGGGDDGGMEARVAKLEAVMPTLATREDVARLEGVLRSEIHKAITDQTWKIVTWTTGIAGLMAAAVFFIAKNVR